MLAAAQRDGWTGALYYYEPEPFEHVHNLSASIWVAMTRDPGALERLKQASGADATLWRPLKARPGFAGWTDDHASILPLLQDWRNWVPPSVRGR